MHAAEESPWKYLVLWLRLYFAIHYLASGLNFVIFNFVPDFSHAGRVGPYLHAMTDIGFYQVIKYLEVVLGTMLLFNLAVPLALIVMAGISVTIIYLNLFISPAPRQLFTGLQELLLNGALLLAYGGYYANFCRVRTRPFWFWDGLSHPSRAESRE
ncbi:conserved membrane hypothetical protein [Cupriavidus taiwanensis]|uniref:DoxX family protein n=1 Tax=Cupriavidus taiwanensis TaxID=164546 RepID=A0A976AZB4_9BURK|nr:hypothetical protein [Cupriavidus taiwanensis]SOZ18790.1 conserved membrane hypothetical protein [Cupriavidus taiwanensis]SOZ32072.1 conserved membrane hypothetical protein [Cupriavidus taiwanensis]SOZ47702.1 conserved membrane hypothetical protein [Cupriavidus taiwanensis]SOZ61979.1 conserved membrane hypothetical protein [Cupriavidus taiwanensis]SOZ62221.1 conserved membrane hypothetical protein [Cupriavidus taiwanensis]